MEKRRVLSRVRRGALYLSHRRATSFACELQQVARIADGSRHTALSRSHRDAVYQLSGGLPMQCRVGELRVGLRCLRRVRCVSWGSSLLVRWLRRSVGHTENLPSHLIGPLKATTSLAAFSCLSTGYPRGRDFRSERGACRGASGITRWAAGAIRGAATKISARLPAIATVEKRRVLSRVRRGALYLSHRRYEQSPSEQPCRKPSSLPASPVRSGHRYR